MGGNYATGAALATAQTTGPHSSGGMDKAISVSIIDLIASGGNHAKPVSRRRPSGRPRAAMDRGLEFARSGTGSRALCRRLRDDLGQDPYPRLRFQWNVTWQGQAAGVLGKSADAVAQF